MRKVFALGNSLLKDDGVALNIVNSLKGYFKERRLKVFRGETDIDYCFSNLYNNDFIIIIDATYYGITPGTVTKTSLNKYNFNREGYSQHGLGLLDLVKLYKLDITGFLIGIEIGKIDYGLELSEIIQENYNYILRKVKIMIDSILLIK